TPTGLTLAAHIWARHQGDYYEIGEDGVPHYAESSRGSQPIANEKISPDGPQPGVHAGGCECGAVKYQVNGRMRGVLVCHCGQCRRFHGHAPGYSAARRAEMKIEGENNIAWYSASDEAKRGYCRHCGSTLFWAPNGRDTVSVSAGSLKAPTGLKTVRHIFVDDKSDYYRIADGVPQFPGTAKLDPVTF
ncbi:MAG TPA: GFA family protein, partial [Dongiaceae bacterium]